MPIVQSVMDIMICTLIFSLAKFSYFDATASRLT